MVRSNNRLQKVSQHVVAADSVQTLTKVMLDDTMNKNLMEMEYAVRGELVIKAGNYQKMLVDGDTSLPFDEVILCNIGNPQSVGQNPFTFLGCPTSTSHLSQRCQCVGTNGTML